MQLSITTDYAESIGDPYPYLKKIAENGFTHIHWCHQWNTDFLYSKSEIVEIGKWLREFELTLLDLHGSKGIEKDWTSSKEYKRQAGVELVKNRICMAAELGAKVIIMHVPSGLICLPLEKSLYELQPFAKEFGVRIAIENGDFLSIQNLLKRYDSNYLGLCYDSGHGNLGQNGLDNLDLLRERLLSVHLHDNDSISDQHKLLFSGTINWQRLANIIAKSAYTKPISMEVSMDNYKGILDEKGFLTDVYETGAKFSSMVHEQIGERNHTVITK